MWTCGGATSWGGACGCARSRRVESTNRAIRIGPIVGQIYKAQANQGVPGRRRQALHVFRDLDSQYACGPFQLPPEEIGHPQQEDLLLTLLFLEDWILMIEVVEGLRQLECIAGDVRRLAGTQCACQG